MMDAITIWGLELNTNSLSQCELAYLKSLPNDIPPVEWLWQEMDNIWFGLGLNNARPLSEQRISDFYNHPVWLANGIFTRTDPTSVRHRKEISAFLSEVGVSRIADYGGGLGTLAVAIYDQIPNSGVDIIEPFPKRLAQDQIRNMQGVRFTSTLFKDDWYDAIVAQDVLEHVDDPILLASQLAASVRVGGVLIFANCFYPVIRCHLPCTFHLRHTFPTVMHSLGLQYLGTVQGADHAQIFRRQGKLNIETARRAERISKIFGLPINNFFRLIHGARSRLFPQKQTG